MKPGGIFCAQPAFTLNRCCAGPTRHGPPGPAVRGHGRPGCCRLCSQQPWGHGPGRGQAPLAWHSPTRAAASDGRQRPGSDRCECVLLAACRRPADKQRQQPVAAALTVVNCNKCFMSVARRAAAAAAAHGK